MFPFSRYRLLRHNGVIGLNSRNGNYIMRYNQRRFYPLVDNKILCKQRLLERGIAVPALLGRIRTQYEAGHLSSIIEGLKEFVVKPASGSGGDGIMVISALRNNAWVTPGGRQIRLDDMQYHVSGIINGMYSLGGQPDETMLEALVHPDPSLSQLAPEGVADIRLIVYRGVPVMAMIRLPTRRSDGKANLHQGAIGAGIDISTGRTLSAVMDNRVVEEHPDTGAHVAGFELPGWSRLLDLAAACHDAVGLGYLGVDIVLDKDHGPLVLELNARPGLAVQIANRCGLKIRLDRVDAALQPDMDLAARVRLGCQVSQARADSAGDSSPDTVGILPASGSR